MAKRLTDIQKKEIILGFKDGKTIDDLSKEYNCTNLTIQRNLKKNLGEKKYSEFTKKNKSLNSKKTFTDKENKNGQEHLSSEIAYFGTEKIDKTEFNLIQDSEFVEISPLDFQIDNNTRKELSSVPLKEIDFPAVVYIIVDKNIELEIKLLKDFPEWDFLPIEDLNRKTIEIFFDLKTAKRVCKKEQKVIKVPNTDVFRIASPVLVSKGITRIVSAEQLIAL